MSEQGYAFALGTCYACGARFTFDPELVPSVPIDPETDAPPDINPKQGGEERAVVRPICFDCVVLANTLRVRLGRDDLIWVPPGAYPDGLQSGYPRLDD